MSRYRRLRNGSTFFFTVVAYRRRSIFCEQSFRSSLRHAIEFVRTTRPFDIDAWVLLPDHMHCIWTLPDHDADYSTRWYGIKRFVTERGGQMLHEPGLLTESRRKRHESTIWQRRFWEHRIRDEHDFEKHVDYIHFNPVKHGYAPSVRDWPHSTFHRYVREGMYPHDWGGPSSDVMGMSIE